MTTFQSRLFLALYAYLFVVGGFVAYGFLFLLYPIRWIGLLKLYRNIARSLCWLHWSLLPGQAQWGSSIEVNIYVHSDVIKVLGKEKAVVVMNHKYPLDWLALWIVQLHYGVLQDFKAIVKKALLWVPIIGWALFFSETIFVSRDIKKDKEVIFQRLENLSEMSSNFWLVLFCEGTRITPEKHKVSIDYARQKGVEPMKHHLMPRTKGFSVVRKVLDVPALYDTTVMCPVEKPLPLSTFMSGRYAKVDILIRRIPFNEVPYKEDESGSYLESLYRYKDKICDYYATYQEFPINEEPELKNFIKLNINSRKKSLLATLIWSAFLIPPLLYFVHYHLITCVSFRSVATFAVITISGISLVRLMLFSGSTSSSYGRK